MRCTKAAFTLAEVLITLGIIGVVAVMTIPTLIANTTNARYRSQFKKTISTLSQAARMSQAQFGFDYAGANVACPQNRTEGGEHHPENISSFCSLFNGTLSGAAYYGIHTNIPIKGGVKNVETGLNQYKFVGSNADWLYDTGASSFSAYQLSDGTIVAFNKAAKSCEVPIGKPLTNIYIKTVLSNCIGFIDVNGTSLPNKEVTCSSGTNSIDIGSNCVVKNTTKYMADIFPVVFHDSTVEPASGAALYVLKTAK